MTVYIDSKYLYDGVVGMNITCKKRLRIDLRMIRKSYKPCKLTNIVWIPYKHNAVDVIKKNTLTAALHNRMTTNWLDITVKFWFKRKPDALRVWAESSKAKNDNQKISPMAV